VFREGPQYQYVRRSSRVKMTEPWSFSQKNLRSLEGTNLPLQKGVEARPLTRRIKRVHVSIASPIMQPSPNGRSVGIRIVTFEACSGFTHVTAHRIAQPSRAGHPARPFVSYQINRQLSGWILPPQVIRAFGAHCQSGQSRGPLQCSH
jgi:hypothetical protein